MKHIQLDTPFIQYEGFQELEATDAALMQKAIEIRKTAYAPYSKFRVGAAIELDNGAVVTGSNQENAAFPTGSCAERSALYAAASQYPGVKIKQIAISAASDAGDTCSPISPCGNCRQSLLEYESRDNSPIRLLFMGETGPVIESSSVRNLMPFSFDKNFL